MSYTFEKENGKVIEVPQEAWQWGVRYDDETELHQFGNDGKYHQFTEIEQDRVELFSIYRKDMEKRIDIVVTEGMQIFHFYREVHAHYFEEAGKTVRVYAFGWKKDGQAAYHFILPDDRMVMSDKNNVNLPSFDLR